MMSLLRWLLLLIVLTITAITAIWKYSEPIANYVAREQLRALDFELVQLRLLPISAAGVSLPELHVKSAGIDLMVSGFYLLPLPERQFQIVIEEMVVELVDTETEAAAPTLGELWLQLQSALPDVPASGAIQSLHLCQDGACESASLVWHRTGPAVVMAVQLPTQDIELQIKVADYIEASGVFSRPGQIAVGEWRIEPDADLFKIAASGTGLPGLDLEMFRVSGLSGLVESIQVDLTAQVQQSARPGDFQSELVASGEIRSNLGWRFEQSDMSASSSGDHLLMFSYSDFQVQFSLGTHPLVRFSSEAGSGDFALKGANRCDLAQFSLALNCTAEGAQLALQAEGLALDIEFEDLSVIQADEALSSSGRMAVYAQDIETDTVLLSGAADYAFQNGIFRLESQQSRLLGQPATLSLQHHLASGKGEYIAEMNGKAQALVAGLTEYFQTPESDPPAPSIGTEALVRVTSAGGWDTGGAALRLNHDTQINLADIALEYDGYTLKGGRADLTLKGWPEMTGTVDLSVESAFAGVVVEQIRTSLDLRVEADTSAAHLQGRSLSMTTLGGQITSNAFHYDALAGDGAAQLEVTGLKLSELLALQRQDFSCAGSLSGSVPVQIRSGNLSVSDASLAAEAPGGFVRYRPDSSVQTLGKQNEGLLVVLDAMRNFQYHTLSASLDYSEQGQMIARTSLKGANPDYQGGREVHLNLTLEENVKTLLESLRLGADLAEKVSEKSARDL